MGAFLVLAAALVPAFIAVFILIAVTAGRIGLELPEDNPEAFLEKRRAAAAAGRPDGRPVVVCAGDSITQANLSADWVALLRERRPDLAFVNAGINSELAWNLHQRIGPILECRPTRTVVLIGTNDANASLGFTNSLGYLALYRLPEAPSEAFFRDNLTMILRQLRKAGSLVAAASLPPLGEDPSNYAWARIEAYCRIIREVAAAEGADYLPLGEKLREILAAEPPEHPRPISEGGKMMKDALFSHATKGKSWDEISAGNGYRLLVDGIHLNGRAAGLMADLVASWLGETR